MNGLEASVALAVGGFVLGMSGLFMRCEALEWEDAHNNAGLALIIIGGVFMLPAVLRLFTLALLS